MRKSTLALHVAVLSLVLASSGRAQISPVNVFPDNCTPDAPPGSACAELYTMRSTVGDLQGLSLAADPSVTVGVSDDGATGSIQWARQGRNWSFSAIVSSPFDKGAGQASFLGTDGLTRANHLKIEQTYKFWPKFSLFTPGSGTVSSTDLDFQVLTALDRAQALGCIAMKEQLAAAKQRTLAPSFRAAEFDRLLQEAKDLPTRAELLSYLPKRQRNEVNNLTDGEKKAQKLLLAIGDGEEPSFCSKAAIIAGENFLNSLVARGLLSQRGANVPMWSLTVNGGIGLKDFEHLDREAFVATGEAKTTTTTENPWSAGVRVAAHFLTGLLERKADSALILSINRERTFKAAGALTLCKPVEGLAPIESCKTFAGAAPNGEESTVFVLEYRNGWERIGIAPRAFYRKFEKSAAVDKDYGVEVPIYFLTNAKNSFQGGVKLGWSDQDDDGSVAVFVGKSFSIDG
jgi:hypothetical protein